MSPSRKNKLLFALWVVFCVLLLEAGYSALYRYGIVAPPVTVFIQEETENTIRFDPVLGYRITEVPARLGRVTYGELELLGTLVGNNEGFPDEDDFFPERSGEDVVRFAVFGDSYTAAQYMEKNWPDRIEEMVNGDGKKLELLNFSVDGAGLANWWSILFRHIQVKDYELDGIVFAVFAHPEHGDLYRGFTASDHRESVAHSFQLKDWNPDTWPTTYEEALVHFREIPIHILDHDHFEAVLEGSWHPDLPRPWRAYGTRAIMSALRGDRSEKKPLPSFGAGQKALAREMAEYCSANGLKPIIVHIPLKETITHDIKMAEDLKEFAAIFDTDLIDGVDAFAGLSDEEVARHYYPYDGHWNQKGSDRFAAFFEAKLERIAHGIVQNRE